MERIDKQIATGEFVVAMKAEAEDKIGTTTLGRYSIAKTFRGDLEAVSRADMLAGGSSETSAGAYVAVERVEGSLAGKTGSLLLVHRGFRTATEGELEVTVVPGCSTGELRGLEGNMTIRIEGERHFYRFEYRWT